MRILYLDCGMGAAGDMITASLIQHCGDKEGMVDKLNALGIPGVEFKLESCESYGIMGSRMTVTVNGEEEGEGHHHHDHDHHHVHRSLKDMENIIHALNASGTVKSNACGIYRIIAEAEAKVHGREPGEVHFHEVGAMDAVADVTAACLLMEELSPELVMASPLNTGRGTVECAHGILPVPAPATAEIIKDLPSFCDGTEGELLTPTGAAVVKFFAKEYGSMPVMEIGSVGYGIGKKDFGKLSAIRTFFGETAKKPEIVIKGEKVYLRSTASEDLPAFAEWESKPYVQAYFTMNYDRDLKEITDEIEGRADDPGCMDLTICALEDDRLLGRIYISAINDHYDSMDVSRIYVGDPEERGKGYGEDALKCAMDLGFNHMGMERITLDYVNGNDAAHSMYLKLGFKDEGRMRHAGKKNGGYVDLNLMSLLREEYFQKP